MYINFGTDIKICSPVIPWKRMMPRYFYFRLWFSSRDP